MGSIPAERANAFFVRHSSRSPVVASLARLFVMNGQRSICVRKSSGLVTRSRGRSSFGEKFRAQTVSENFNRDFGFPNSDDRSVCPSRRAMSSLNGAQCGKTLHSRFQPRAVDQEIAPEQPLRCPLCMPTRYISRGRLLTTHLILDRAAVDYMKP